MAIIGLQTEKVSPPNEPETTFVLRLALSPRECERAASKTGYEAFGDLTHGVGADAVRTVIAALNEGKSAAEIVERMNEGEEPETDEAKPDPDDVRARYDLDYAAFRLIKAWSYRRENGSKIPVKLKYVRDQDRDTRAWLHDKAWAAMRQHLPEDELEGNS